MAFPSPFYRWRPHPWHGLEIGPNPPSVVHAFIEICPFDLVKYEVDKVTGYMKVDRPHRTSSQHPTLYGFIPRTYCGEKVRSLMSEAKRGDGDPLDVCVISERPIARTEIVVNARIVGGLPMLDGGEADDKIIAILEDDPFWSGVDDISGLPAALISRMRHYFLTYKLDPEDPTEISIGDAYGRDHAWKVVESAMVDYRDEFGDQ